MNQTRILAAALASIALTCLGSCASPKQLKQYQDELRVLREERTQLKKENRDLRAQNEAYQSSLAEASVKPTAPTAVADNPELDALGIEYGNRGGNFVISIPSEVTFPSGKAELTKKGQDALKTVARVLLDQHREGHYWIEGHTDSDPIKKSKWESNRELSVERAMAVLHYLVEDCDVADDKCVVAGHGQYEPIAGNDDNAGKARNRRVEIVVQKR
jgi:chemotaxis protein MotB